MQPTFFIPIFLLWWIIIMNQRKQKETMIKNFIKHKNIHKKERAKMVEFAKKFIEKDCIIYSFNGTQYTGVIKEVSNNALLLDNEGKSEVLNLDFIVRIREYPRDKKGKKKSVVLD